MTSLIPVPVLNAMLAAAEATPSGCFVEVGVYRGGSAARLYMLAQGQHRDLHLFDTFCGMPFADQGDGHSVGDFASIDYFALRQAMPSAHFHEGIFPDTLPRDLTGIAFAHIDCDQYRSVLACIDHLSLRMVPDGIMWFDDFTALDSARRAVLTRIDERRLCSAPDGRVFVRF